MRVEVGRRGGVVDPHLLPLLPLSTQYHITRTQIQSAKVSRTGVLSFVNSDSQKRLTTSRASWCGCAATCARVSAPRP